ncbi:MAG: response regulator transcription factor [Pseudomonadota bacterium]
MTTRPTILIVDDDPHIRDVVRIALAAQGMRSREASNGAAAMTEIARSPVDLIVLDIGMPKMDGFEVCKAVRATSRVPILFLTARDEEVDRILGFEFGADDYVGKPFSPRELVLRIKAILARGHRAEGAALTFGHLALDAASHGARLGPHALHLTATEFALLAALLRSKGQVFDRNRLIDAAYGGNSQLSGRTVDSHIRNIRAKAAALGCEDIIETVHGVGVRLGPCTT